VPVFNDISFQMSNALTSALDRNMIVHTKECRKYTEFFHGQFKSQEGRWRS